MSDVALPAPQASPTAIVKAKRDKAATVTGKVRDALMAMVWEGLPRKQAAERAGISEHGLYKALRKPVVKALYQSELDVLRTSERARNIHRLTEIRDAADNMPAVNAIKMLEQIDEASAAGGSSAQRSPGVTIVVVNHTASAPNPVQVIDNSEGDA